MTNIVNVSGMSDKTNSSFLADQSNQHNESGTIPNRIHKWWMVRCEDRVDIQYTPNLGALFSVAEHHPLSSIHPAKNSYRLDGYQHSHPVLHLDTFSGLHSTFSSSISVPFRAPWIMGFSTNQLSITVMGKKSTSDINMHKSQEINIQWQVNSIKVTG